MSTPAITPRAGYGFRQVRGAGVAGMVVTLAFLFSGAVLFGIPAAVVYAGEPITMVAPWLGAALASLVGLPMGGYHAGRRLGRIPDGRVGWLGVFVATPGVWLALPMVIFDGLSEGVIPFILFVTTLSGAGVLIGAGKSTERADVDA